MSTKLPSPPYFPDDNPLGPGQSHGCPCYVALRYFLSILFPYSLYPHLSHAVLSDIFGRLIWTVDDHLYFNLLHTTMADSVTTYLAPDAGFPHSCHNLSPMEPNSTHHPLPPTRMNTDNDMNYSSVSEPDSMPVNTLDPVSSTFDESLFDFATASMDVGLSPMSSEPAVSQWLPSSESLFEGNFDWDQALENKDTYNYFEEHSSHTIQHQAQNSSSAHLHDLAWHASPCSEEGSSLESEHSSFTDDHDIHLCRWDVGCGLYVEAEKSEVARHLQAAHGAKPGGDKLPMKCLWDGCGSKPMNKESISRHIVAVHLSKKTECTSCGKQFARLDSKLRHIKNSKRECSDSESESHDSPVKRHRLS
ncbi:hypothetical protein K503DRAFT_800395 [Rhizopogon vinicolor AM-OR11-026]|uniref:C2H2-type domain-containing protein n=1 Tax=Rhizopogon vinicolor AM-OR11-026 TaxID=1314800 RepID=A0A1B7N0Z1_9AGAM|nr:hypothetical protein K503DRAFT_800395 [Rhizopogon vinicolor AM-OR11-026]